MKREIITREQIRLIKDYYKKCSLWIPDNPQWRSWKLKLPNGDYKRFNIKSEEELRKVLIKFTPLRVYYSAIAIYNMRNVKGKNSKNQIKIYSDFIVDIDNEDFEKARFSAIEVIDKLLSPNYILKTYKGIHLNYFKRGKDKKEMIEKIKNIPYVDVKCSENEYNEFSCPLTLNKGKVCVLLTYNQLKNWDKNLIEGIQRKVYDYTSYNSKEEPERQIANDQGINIPSSRNASVKMQSKLNRPGSLTGSKDQVLLSINNQAKRGIYIPILIYNKEFRNLKRELDNINTIFNLGDLYAFESENYYAFISLRCFERRQLEKLLNASKSLTKDQFRKFNKIWFDISNYQIMGKINYKVDKYFRASKKHYNFLTDCGIKIEQVDELVGHPELKFYEVRKEQ